MKLEVGKTYEHENLKGKIYHIIHYDEQTCCYMARVEPTDIRSRSFRPISIIIHEHVSNKYKEVKIPNKAKIYINWYKMPGTGNIVSSTLIFKTKGDADLDAIENKKDGYFIFLETQEIEYIEKADG